MAAFHARFKKSNTADTPPQSPDAVMDSKAQQAALIKKKFDTFHSKYQNSPPSSENSPHRESSSNSTKADAIDSLPLIEKKSTMTSEPSKSQATYDSRYQLGPPSIEPSLRHEATSKSSKNSKSPKVKKPDKADAEAIKAQFAAIHTRYQKGPSHPDAAPFRRSSNSTSSSKSTNSEAHQQGQALMNNLGRAAVQNSHDNRPAERPQRSRPPEPAQLDNGADDRGKNRLSSMFTRSKPPQSTNTESLITPIEEEEERAVRQGMDRSNGTAKANAKRDLAIRPTGPYEPPPLFQAYPQSVKHTTLPAPILSADVILQDRKSKKAGFDTALDDDVSRKGGRDSRLLQALHQETDGDHWTRHEYVLVTSGYLLQYSEAGAHDRLPEKTLQLGKNSAAFVSDALPGKYYVLQVSTDAEEDGLLKQHTSTKSMFKKMSFRGEHTKRAVSNFLLVFGTPEEMEAWIIAVRKEIENLGGKPYLPDGHGEANKGEEINGVVNGQNSRYYTITTPVQRFESLDRKPDSTKNRNRMNTSNTGSQPAEGTTRIGSRATTKGSMELLDQQHAPELRRLELAYSDIVPSKERMIDDQSSTGATDGNTRNGNVTAGQQQMTELPKLEFSEVMWGDEPKSTANRSAQEDKEAETLFNPITTNPSQRNVLFPDPPPNATASDSRKASVASSTSTSSGFVLLRPKSTSQLTPEHRRKSIPNFSKRYTIINSDEESSDPPHVVSSVRSSLFTSTTSPNISPSSATAHQSISKRPSSTFVAPPPPKRYSSLAHFYGVPPTTTPLLLPPEISAKLPAPMPPPTGALPAVPRSRSAVVSGNRRSWYVAGLGAETELEAQRSVSERMVSNGLDEGEGTGAFAPKSDEEAAITGSTAKKSENDVHEATSHERFTDDPVAKQKGNKLRKRQPPPAKTTEQRRHSSYDVNEKPWLRDRQQHIEQVIEGEKWQQSQAHNQSPILARSPPSPPPPPLRRASTLMQLRSFMAGNEP